MRRLHIIFTFVVEAGKQASSRSIPDHGQPVIETVRTRSTGMLEKVGYLTPSNIKSEVRLIF